MSFNEEKSPPKDNAKPDNEENSKPNLEECIKQKVSEGMSEEEAKGYCEKQEEKEKSPEEEQKPPNKDEAPPKEEEQQNVQEITPEEEQKPQEQQNAPPQQDPNNPNAPQQDPNAPPGQGEGFGQYQNFEQCLQDQLGQGINQKDSVVNCAAQLLVHMQNQGQAAPMDNMNGPGGSNPPMAASYNIGGVEFKVSEFPDFESCVVAFKGKGMGKEEAITKCNSIFNAKFDKSAIATQQIQVQKAKEGSDKLYVRAFLLDSSLNKNYWGVDTMSIDQRISSFVGRPLVLTEDFGHPELSDMNLSHALQYQDIFRIGTIIDVVQTAKSEHDKNKKVYYAIIEITDQKAKEAFKNNHLPLYVSPAVAKLNAAEADNNINEWLGMHLAVVDKPAFGVAKAQITGTCSGEEDKCVMRLKQAKIDKDGYGNCGFCVYAKLTSVLKTAKLQVGENKEREVVEVSNNTDKKSNSSLTSENTQKQLTMSNTEQSIESKVAEAKEEIKKAELEKQEKTSTKENVDKFPDKSTSDYAGFDIVQAKLVRYQTENTLLKAKLEEVNTNFEELNQKYKDLQNESRRAQISSIVTAELYPEPTQRQKMIDFFIEKNLPAEMVAEMYASLGNNISSKTAKTYDSKVPVVKTAKTNSDLESTSLAKESRKMFIKGGNKA